MTSLYDTTKGEGVEFDRIFHQAGGDAELVRAVIRMPALMDAMVEAARRQLQVARPLSWDVSLESKIDRVRAFLGVFGGGRPGFRMDDIPLAPESFTPATPTEVLLLMVYLDDLDGVPGYLRTFDTCWQAIPAPPGYTKERWDGLKSDPALLRLLPGIEYRPGIRWVGFDPFANWNPTNGRTIQSLWDGTDSNSLAHAEVLMAGAQLPDWLNGQDGTTIPRPDMAGLQRREHVTEDESDEEAAAWQSAPCLRRWDDNRQLRLVARWAGFVNYNWSAPRVRELPKR